MKKAYTKPVLTREATLSKVVALSPGDIGEF